MSNLPCKSPVKSPVKPPEKPSAKPSEKLSTAQWQSELSCEIPEHLNKTHVRYRLLSFKQPTSEIGCGFVRIQNTPKRVFGSAAPGYYGLLLILRGHGTLVTAQNQTYKVGPGHALQFSADSRHVLYHETDDWLEATTSTDQSLIERFLLLNDMDIHCPVLQPGLSPSLVQSFELLHEALTLDSRSFLPGFLLQVQQLVLQVHVASQSHSTAQNQEHRELEKACLLLEDNAYFQLGLEQIAAVLKMDYRQMRYLFQKHLNLSPGQYRLKHKMAVAVNMLAQGHRNIASIARDLGYSDTFTFSRQFKIFHGKSPSQCTIRESYGLP